MKFRKGKLAIALAGTLGTAALVAGGTALAQAAPQAPESAAPAPAQVAQAGTPAPAAPQAPESAAPAPVQVAQAGTPPPQSATPAPATNIKVEVVGSSIKRSLEDQALPVQILTNQDISRAGVQNMEQLVQKISATATTGATGGGTLAGTETYGQSSVSLRGLGSQRTLLLLDGQRMAPFAQEFANGVDINAIPISAVERVEVLTDGASSVYGSDAVAGVINFVLRRNFTGATVGYEYDRPTTHPSAGGTTNNWWGSVGYGDISKDKYNFTVSYQNKQEYTLSASDRDFAKSGNVPPFLSNAATPSGRIEGVWVPGSDPASNNASSTNPFGISTAGYGNPGADSPGCAAMGMFAITAKPRAGTGTNCNFDSAPFVALFPRVGTQSWVGTADAQLTPDARLYFTGMWTENKVTQSIQANPARIAFFQTDPAFEGSGIDQALLIYPTNPNYPHAWLQSHGLAAMDGQVLAVTSRAFATGARVEYDKNTQQDYVVGVKGTWLKDWDYDVNGSWSKSQSDGSLTGGYFSQTCYANAWNTLGNTAGSYVDPWSVGGAQNSTLTNAFVDCNYRGPTATASEPMWTFGAKTSGNIYEMAAGPVAMAVGYSYVHQSYSINVPDILASGDISGLGGAVANQSGSRSINSGYIEIAIPWTKEFNTTLSGRIDHYSDIQEDATPVTGKISATWQPWKWGMFRGSLGNGFRAPSLGELYKPVTLGTSEQFIDPLFADQGPIQVNALGGGNLQLRPEKSNQADVGFVWTPTAGFTGRIDYWWIQIKNYIGFAPALAQVNAARAGGSICFPNEVEFAPDGEVNQVNEQNCNFGKAQFSGIDGAVEWRIPSAYGTWTLNYNGTYYVNANLNTVLSWEHSIGTLVDNQGNPLTLPITGGVIPRYKQIVSANWTYGPWGATLANNYISKYQTAPNQVDGLPHAVPSFNTWDMQGTYSGFKYLQLVLGLRNAFNKSPNLFIPTANQFQYGYDVSNYDPRGRVVYARAIVSWP